MNPTEIIICVALCMFLEGELVEHTYQGSMADCLKVKRQAERSIQPERVQFKCGKNVKAEVEILEDGTWHIIKILGRYEPAYKKKKTYE